MFGDRLPKGVDILPQAKRGGSVKLVCLRLGPFPRQFDDFFTNGIRHAASVGSVALGNVDGSIG